MKEMQELLQKMVARLTNREERGASAVEYGLLIAGIAALIVVVVFALGPIVKEAFNKTCDTIGSNDNNASTSADCAS